MNTVVNIMGYSGAGKDTLATLLTLFHDRYHRVKFADSIKREVEARLGLPHGFAEHRLVKQSGVQDILVDTYHALKDMSADYKLGRVPETVRLCHKFGLVPVFTDVRNPCEAAFIKSYKVLNIWVEGGVVASSDVWQRDLFDDIGGMKRWVNYCDHRTLEEGLEYAGMIHGDVLRYSDG